MRGVIKIADPNEVFVSLTITQNVRDWKALRKQLVEGAHPSSALSSLIFDLILKAERGFDAADAEDSAPRS